MCLLTNVKNLPPVGAKEPEDFRCYTLMCDNTVQFGTSQSFKKIKTSA